MSCSAELISDGSVRKSMESSEYYCNFIDAEPRERPLIGDEALTFLNNTFAPKQNNTILSG